MCSWLRIAYVVTNQLENFETKMSDSSLAKIKATFIQCFLFRAHCIVGTVLEAEGTICCEQNGDLEPVLFVCLFVFPVRRQRVNIKLIDVE